MKTRNLICMLFIQTAVASVSLSAESVTSSSSYVDWIKKQFRSDITLDTQKAGITMPSGKNSAAELISMKLPILIKDPFLSLNVDSENSLGNLVLDETLTLEQITNIIEAGNRTPDVFAADGVTLKTTNTIRLNNISRLLIRQRYPYEPEEPVDSVSSRAYTGIIIDARGSLPVQGEYVESVVSPCFFPKIWNEDMDMVYERNMMTQDDAQKKGIAAYDYSDDQTRYEDRIGTDPLFITAEKVYGHNRTDPVIRTKDALRILTVDANRKLLRDGKVVILLNKDELIHAVSAPEKDDNYYVAFNQVKQYFYENKVGITLNDTEKGILVSVDLKFYPDSPKLLPEELPRIAKIAEILRKIVNSNEFTILVEGHTADVGKPTGQMNLSIERTRTVMNALVSEGIPKTLFTYKGYGGTMPVATNATEEGRKQNRRVDITARPRATYIQRDW